MGLIANVIEFIRTTVEGEQVIDVKADPGGEDTLTADHLSPAGVDAPPLPNDYVGLTPGPGKRRWMVVGYLDQNNEGVAVPGELRLYSRDDAGAIVSSVYMKADGTVNIGDDDAETEIPRDDKLQAELAAIKETFDSIVFTVDTGDGTGTPGTIGKPYSPGATKSSKGRVT